MKIWDLSRETYFGPSNGTFLSYEFIIIVLLLFLQKQKLMCTSAPAMYISAGGGVDARAVVQ